MVRRRLSRLVALAIVALSVAPLVSCGAERTLNQGRDVAASPPVPSSSTPKPASRRSANALSPTAFGSWENDCYQTPVRTFPQWQPIPMSDAEKKSLKDCAAAQSPLECKYAHARTFYEHQYWELSAPIFRELALDPDSGDRGLDAARLYVESLNSLGLHGDPPRPSCFQMMVPDVKEVLTLHCQKHGSRREERCSWFRMIDYDFERWKAYAIADGAKRGLPSAQAQFVQGGDQYIALFDRACRGRDSHDPDKYTHCDDVLYRAFIAFNLGGAKSKADAARSDLLPPGATLSVTPSTIDFGTHMLTGVGCVELTVTNTGTVAGVPIFSIAGPTPHEFVLTVEPGGGSLARPCTPGTSVAPGASCHIVAEFVPLTRGNKSASIKTANSTVVTMTGSVP